MLISEPFPFVLKGESANMYVLRNDGYCWGRIKFDSSPDQLDVPSLLKDYYDSPDDEAAAAFIRLAHNGKTEDITGWEHILSHFLDRVLA